MIGHKAAVTIKKGSGNIITVGGDENQILYKYTVDNNGAISGPIDLNFSSIETIDQNGMQNAFPYTLISSISFPALTSVGVNGLSYTFRDCMYLTGSVSFPELTTIGRSGLYCTFYNCTGLTGSVSFPSLTFVDSNGLYRVFYNTGITTVHFKSSLSDNSELTAENIFGTTSGKSVPFDL